MADEVAINGVDRMLEISESEDLKGSKLMQNIEVLEREKGELVHDNKAMRDMITKLQGQLEVLEREKARLEREIVRSDADKKALELIAARAAELEAEVSRLQHDLITAEADGAEANKEVRELRREVDVLEKERALLLKQIDEVENELRVVNEAGEERVRELNKKLEGLVERENCEKAKIAEKEREIQELKKRVEGLQLVILQNDEEIEKMKKEKEEFEGAKSFLQGLLERSEHRVKDLEEKLGQLGKDMDVSGHVISGLKEKRLDGINGIHVIENGGKGMFGVKKLQWPVLAVSTGVVVTVGALWYMRSKQK